MKLSKILALYNLPSLNPINRLFIKLRFFIAPFEAVLNQIPPGRVLDIGCGYGILANLIAELRPNTEVTGIDIDRKRIKIAQQTAIDRPNIRFKVIDVEKKLLQEKYDAVICFDLLHHIPYKNQIALVRQIRSLLTDKGVLIIKEIDTRPYYKYLWNYLHDKIVTKGGSLYFREAKNWVDVLQKQHFNAHINTRPKKGYLYPHVTIICQKNTGN